MNLQELRACIRKEDGDEVARELTSDDLWGRPASVGLIEKKLVLLQVLFANCNEGVTLRIDDVNDGPESHVARWPFPVIS